MSLVDIIQIFNAERKTVAVHLGSELGYGRVYLKDGNITHASYRDVVGPEAFFTLITWRDGEFEVEPEMEAPAVTIDRPAEGLILEGFRRLDESGGKGAEPRHGYGADGESMRLVNRLIELGILEKA